MTTLRSLTGKPRLPLYSHLQVMAPCRFSSATSRREARCAWRMSAPGATRPIRPPKCCASATIWTPDQPIPDEFHAAASDGTVVAHNDQFETAIEARLLHPRYGWPIIPIDRHRCTMAAALANALPASLEGAAEALGLSARKDADGRRLMLQMSKPRKARKGEDPELVQFSTLRRVRVCRNIADAMSRSSAQSIVGCRHWRRGVSGGSMPSLIGAVSTSISIWPRRRGRSCTQSRKRSTPRSPS